MTIQKKNLITYRASTTDDEHFILSTWLRGLYYGNSWFRQIPKEIYFKNYEPLLKKKLPHLQTQVACLVEDPSIILGYAVMEKKQNLIFLHWVFVKKTWREIKIAKDLMKPFKIEAVTHLTTLGKQLLPKHIHFNPFAF